MDRLLLLASFLGLLAARPGLARAQEGDGARRSSVRVLPEWDRDKGYQRASEDLSGKTVVLSLHSRAFSMMLGRAMTHRTTVFEAEKRGPKGTPRLQGTANDVHGLVRAMREVSARGARVGWLVLMGHGSSGYATFLDEGFEKGSAPKLERLRGLDEVMAPGAEVRLIACNVGKGAYGRSFSIELAKTLLGRHGGVLWAPMDLYFTHALVPPLRGVLTFGRGYRKIVIAPGGAVAEVDDETAEDFIPSARRRVADIRAGALALAEHCPPKPEHRPSAREAIGRIAEAADSVAAATEPGEAARAEAVAELYEEWLKSLPNSCEPPSDGPSFTAP